jgi:Fe-S-cluster containining protein
MNKRKRGNHGSDVGKISFIESSMTPLVNDRGDPYSMESNDEQPLEPMIDQCEVCPAKCCAGIVILSLPDAIEFCQTLGVPFLSGLRFNFWQDVVTETAFPLDHDERISPESQPGQWTGKADITLPRNDDGICKFLVDMNGYKRCGVYAARPSGCRTYPLAFKRSGKRTGPQQIACSAPFGVTRKMENEYRIAAASSHKNWCVHSQVIKQWEAFEPEDGRTVENFLLYTIPLAARLSGLQYDKVLFHRNGE